MKKPILLQSLRDLAREKACAICSPDKPYFNTLVDVFEKKLFDEYVQQILDDENERRVRPFLLDYCKKTDELPFPFTVNGKDVNKIRKDPKYSWSLDVSQDEDQWLYLDKKDCVRLFNDLDSAGLLDFEEE